LERHQPIPGISTPVTGYDENIPLFQSHFYNAETAPLDTGRTIKTPPADSRQLDTQDGI
jgi:hypothetical protein